MTRATVLLLSLLVLLPLFTESAKYCFSGQNNRYVKKQCSTGGDDLEYTCQKFVCEGGRDPFDLRSCAESSDDPCAASDRLCQQNGGVGRCNVCSDDYCNSAPSFSTVLSLAFPLFLSFLFGSFF
ncbi:hypothetical protein QR680_005397 [Steinernema hermaphroditum]|uniref:Uncharacterized protein n=1 Tax=Steinernema hermaphroditum TaxID=289476 RepID=A0AA39HSW9_9BILA|nr:hypothetical protein QR680_005397 [Steinernema hermaphroditum]